MQKEIEISSDKMVLIRREVVKGKTIEHILRAPTTPLARTADPDTSHAAAENAKSFTARHEALIWTALKDHGEMIPAQIARRTNLDYHAVQRRIAAMIKNNLVERLPETLYGQHYLKAKG